MFERFMRRVDRTSVKTIVLYCGTFGVVVGGIVGGIVGYVL